MLVICKRKPMIQNRKRTISCTSVMTKIKAVIGYKSVMIKIKAVIDYKSVMTKIKTLNGYTSVTVKPSRLWHKYPAIVQHYLHIWGTNLLQDT